MLELLARRRGRSVRLVDLERELDLTKATAHAIMNTLCDRDWVRRNVRDKTFSLGPGLSKVAEQAPSVSGLDQSARLAAIELAADTGFNASMVKLVDDIMVFVVFDPTGREVELPGSSDRVVFAAPFGPIFAAYDPDRARAWVEQSGVSNPVLLDRFQSVLTMIRDRGLAIERLSPVMMRASRLGYQLRQEAGSEPMRPAMDQLLGEVTSLGYLHQNTGTGVQHPITSIAAPVFDPDGNVVLAIAVFPFKDLSATQTEKVGRRVSQAATILNRTEQRP